MTPAPPAPLEAQDPRRAHALKQKVLDRFRDVRRHLDALRAAMATFGENFDVSSFKQAFASDDPDELNRVKAVERGVDQLYNYTAELAAFGLELAGLRDRSFYVAYGAWIKAGFVPPNEQPPTHPDP